MFREGTIIDRQDTEKLVVSLQNNESFDFKMKGECIDRIFKNGVLIEERVGHNLVVTSFLKLITYALKNSNGGIKYWAVGQGASSWDSNMPNPTLSEIKLTSEIGRVAISSSDITFLNSNGTTSSTPTNIIQVKHTFGTDDCNGTWREFGIFGGTATATANSGIMMNKRHHAVITKTSDMTIERVMKFTLGLS